MNMATFYNTAITEDITKSISHQTLCKWKGLNVAKKKISANSSKTIAQQMQRKRWAKAFELNVLFAPASEVGFPERKPTESYHNAFMAANGNERAIPVSEDLEVTVSYPDVLCAQGRWIKLPRTMSVSADAEMRSLTFTHAAEENGTMRYGDDMLYAMVVDTDLQDAELYELNARNNSEPVMITLPDDWDMDALAVYVFALTADKKKASNSKYMEIA